MARVAGVGRFGRRDCLVSGSSEVQRTGDWLLSSLRTHGQPSTCVGAGRPVLHLWRPPGVLISPAVVFTPVQEEGRGRSSSLTHFYSLPRDLTPTFGGRVLQGP